MKEFFSILMVAVVVSFIGFCVENIWLAFSKGFMDNRNMYLPFLLGYGLAMIAVYVFFGLPHRPMFLGNEILVKSKYGRYIYYYFCVFMCISVGEIVLGKTVEKICGYQWWNYSWIPLHITQYTSVPTSMGLAAIVFLFMRYCFDPLTGIFMKMNGFKLMCLSVTMMAALTIDMIYNLHYIYKNGKGKVRWCVNGSTLKKIRK